MVRRLALAAVATLAGAAAARARPGQVVTVVQPPATPTLGPADALVTIDLYFVPGAEASNAAYRVVRDVALRHPARIRARFWPRVVGPRRLTPALALAAHRHGKFFAFMDALVAQVPPAGPAGTVALAVDLGIDRDAAARAATDPDIVAALAVADRRAFRSPSGEAIDVVLNGRPAAIGPGHLTPASFTAAQLEQAYQEALADARLAAAQGLTGPPLLRWGRLHAYCEVAADDDDEPATGDDAPPRFAWSLGALLDRGSTCPAPTVRAARLDDPPVLVDTSVPAPARLLATPLPTAALPALGTAAAAVPVAIACNPRGDACRAQLSALSALVPIYDGDVRLVWLPFIDLGFEAAAPDLDLAGAALCAAELGDGWPFASDPPGVRRDPPTAADLAREAHADPDDVAACVAASRDRVRTLVAAAERAGISAGPTVVIGGRAYVGGFIDAAAAALVVEAALAPGLLEQLAP